jgi:hypothetical protein
LGPHRQSSSSSSWRAANTGIFYMTCIWLKTSKIEFDVLIIDNKSEVYVTLKIPGFAALWYTCEFIVSKN